MYINTLLNGLKVFPRVSLELKKKGKQLMQKIGSKNFYNKLIKKNKTCVYKINPNDKIRLLRSWEIFEVSKKSIYEINQENKINVYFCYSKYDPPVKSYTILQKGVLKGNSLIENEIIYFLSI